MEKCKRCDRQMIARPDDEYAYEWQHEYDYVSENYESICSGCDAVINRQAVEGWCNYHDHTCVIANHYAKSLHLCRDSECIEHQDITTLMINASYARWKDDGEENPFFDRITKVSEELEAGTAQIVNLTGMTREERRNAMFVDRSDMSDEEYMAYLRSCNDRAGDA